MKTFNFILIWTVSLLACAFLLGKAIDNSNDLMGVGECVEAMAGIEHFDGTSKEKWDTFAGYCKNK